MPEALVGQGVAAIDTPALVIDLDAMERNLRRMADFAAARGVRLRPHAKMHKCAELARLQMAHGAVGVCVQKIGEALALARGGVTDIYISNQVVDPGKLLRLAEAVAQQSGVRWAIAVDSADGVAQLASAMAKAGVQATGAIDVFVEIDAGQNRCGVVPGDAAVTLARQVLACPVLRWAGLQAYHGRAQHLRSAEERELARCLHWLDPAPRSLHVELSADLAVPAAPFVRRMIAARWFSTVRWLIFRSAAMFLLGWPASTRSMTCCCRGVRPPSSAAWGCLTSVARKGAKRITISPPVAPG